MSYKLKDHSKVCIVGDVPRSRHLDKRWQFGMIYRAQKTKHSADSGLENVIWEGYSPTCVCLFEEQSSPKVVLLGISLRHRVAGGSLTGKQLRGVLEDAYPSIATLWLCGGRVQSRWVVIAFDSD